MLVTVEAGHSFQDLVDTAIAECPTGLETLTGIPGTVGATPVQNAGAYGQEVADSLVSVEACRPGTEPDDRTQRHEKNTYRQVADALGVPLETSVPLAEAAAGVPAAGVPAAGVPAAGVPAVRRSKGMVLTPGDRDNRNAGSVFLRPVITPQTAERLRAPDAPVHDSSDRSTRAGASRLIKETGFALGERLSEGVRLSTEQYTLVADHGATAAAFAVAAEIIVDTVHKATGVQLTPVPDLFGDEPAYRHLTGPGLRSRPLQPSGHAPRW